MEYAKGFKSEGSPQIEAWFHAIKPSSLPLRKKSHAGTLRAPLSELSIFRFHGTRKKEWRGGRAPKRNGKGVMLSAPRPDRVPHLTVPCRCSASSKGLSRHAWPPTQMWSPPAVGLESQIPPGGNPHRPCTSHYCCLEERLSLDSPGERKRQRICGSSEGTREARRPSRSDHTPRGNQAHRRWVSPCLSLYTRDKHGDEFKTHTQDDTNTKALCHS